MGTAQARLARHFGDEIIFAVDRDLAAIQRFSQEFHIAATEELSKLPTDLDLSRIDLVWLTVTDSEISPTARKLCSVLNPKTVILHTSGALSSDAAADELPDFACGSLHPLISCPLVTVTDLECVNHYRGVLHTFDGAPNARNFAQILADRLESVIAEIPSESKPLYHASAVFASNYPIVLADIAVHLFEKCGFTRQMALNASRRLILQCAESLQRALPADALTGPAKRNDVQTIEMHRKALEQTPDLLNLYNMLYQATRKML